MSEIYTDLAAVENDPTPPKDEGDAGSKEEE